MSLEMGKEPAS